MAVVLIYLVNGFNGKFVLYQCNNMFILLWEVREYKSCGVFISLVWIFEHCYFVDSRHTYSLHRHSRAHPFCCVFSHIFHATNPPAVL